MKVITDAGVIEIGTTEAAPTIGLTDYSRRETDDFGVTTVVKRNFSRTMSARVMVPTANVDALQQQLAALHLPVFIGRGLQPHVTATERPRLGKGLGTMLLESFLQCVERLDLERIGRVVAVEHGARRHAVLRLAVGGHQHIGHLALNERRVLPVVGLDARHGLALALTLFGLGAIEQRGIAIAACVHVARQEAARQRCTSALGARMHTAVLRRPATDCFSHVRDDAPLADRAPLDEVVGRPPGRSPQRRHQHTDEPHQGQARRKTGRLTRHRIP